MGCLSSQSDRPSHLRKAVGLALIAILGAPRPRLLRQHPRRPDVRRAKKLVVTGDSSGRTINIDSSFTGGLTQSSTGGMMTLALDSQATSSLSWDTVLQDGAATVVTGHVTACPAARSAERRRFAGRARRRRRAVTFDLQALHACDASSVVLLGEILAAPASLRTDRPGPGRGDATSAGRRVRSAALGETIRACRWTARRGHTPWLMEAHGLASLGSLRRTRGRARIRTTSAKRWRSPSRQAFPNLRGESSERTFVFRIAHNRGLTFVARRRPPAEASSTSSSTPLRPAPSARPTAGGGSSASSRRCVARR